MLLLLAFQLYAFDLEIPREQALVRPRCEATFPTALAQKEEYEARVRVQCLHGLPGKEMRELNEAFVENCVATTNVRIRKMSGPGRVEIDDALIADMFNYDYRPIFQKACMDRELSRFYQRNSGSGDAPAATASPRINEVYR